MEDLNEITGTVVDAAIKLPGKQLRAYLVDQIVAQFDSVWRGEFCRVCGRRKLCADPVVWLFTI